MNLSNYNKNLRIKGYVLTESILKNLEELTASIVKLDEDSVRCNYEISLEKGLDKNLQDLDSVVKFFENPRACKRLTLETTNRSYKSQSRISIIFHSDGDINIRFYGNTENDFEYKIEKIIGEIEKCEPGSNKFLTFVFQKHDKTIKFLIGSATLLTFVIFTFNVWYLNYAKKVGVNVSSEILVDGNSYYEQVDKAIASESTNEKLNVLLRGQLKNFTNVKDVVEQTSKRAKYFGIAFVLSILMLLLQKFGSSLFPASFYSIGVGKEKLTAIQRKREILFVVIILGIIVNIASTIITSITSDIF